MREREKERERERGKEEERGRARAREREKEREKRDYMRLHAAGYVIHKTKNPYKPWLESFHEARILKRITDMTQATSEQQQHRK